MAPCDAASVVGWLEFWPLRSKGTRMASWWSRPDRLPMASPDWTFSATTMASSTCRPMANEAKHGERVNRPAVAMRQPRDAMGQLGKGLVALATTRGHMPGVCMWVERHRQDLAERRQRMALSVLCPHFDLAGHFCPGTPRLHAQSASAASATLLRFAPLACRGLRLPRVGFARSSRAQSGSSG